LSVETKKARLSAGFFIGPSSRLEKLLVAYGYSSDPSSRQARAELIYLWAVSQEKPPSDSRENAIRF